MRICHVTPSFLPTIGGLEMVVDQIAQHEALCGHQIWVMARHAGKPHHLGRRDYQMLSYSKMGLNWSGMFIGLLRHHRRHHFDVVHAHGIFPAGWAAALFSYFTGVPFVFTSHGGDARGVTGFEKFCLRRVFRRVACGTAVSKGQGRLVAELGFPESQLHIIPNGVQLEEFRDLETTTSPLPAPYLLFVGRLVPVKGPDLVMETFGKLRASHPGLRLALMGPESAAAWDKAGLPEREPRRLAKELGIAEAVDFIGVHTGTTKLRWFQHAEAVVVGSRSEGLSVVILEAMAAGRPVAAFRVGGIPELVQPERTGFLAAPENCEELAQHLCSLLENPELRRSMGAQARRQMAAYDWTSLARQYGEIYEKVVAEKQR